MNLKNLLSILFLLFSVFACNFSKSCRMLEASNINLHLENGILYYEETPFSGDLVTYYNDNILKSDIEYVNGRKHGMEKHWYQSSTRAITRYYKKGFKSGLHQGWWENGKPKFEYYFNDNGEYNGSVKEWDASGLLVMHFNYKDGQEIGRQRSWNLDGSTKANYEVKDGERFGLIGLKKCYQVTVGNDEVE